MMVEFVDVWAGPLDGASFAAPRGAITALAGPEGAGKTLAFRLVCGLERPQAGAVIVAGSDMSRARTRARRDVLRRLSAVFQGDALFEAATVRDNLLVALHAAGRSPRHRIDTVASGYLERFGLAAFAGARPGELGPSERKRLALARALALAAPLVVIDALEDGLGAGELPEICALLQDERDVYGTTVLATTRSPVLAAALADHVVGFAG